MMRQMSHWAWRSDRALARWGKRGWLPRACVFVLWLIAQLADMP